MLVFCTLCRIHSFQIKCYSVGSIRLLQGMLAMFFLCEREQTWESWVELATKGGIPIVKNILRKCIRVLGCEAGCYYDQLLLRRILSIIQTVVSGSWLTTPKLSQLFLRFPTFYSRCTLCSAILNHLSSFPSKFGLRFIRCSESPRLEYIIHKANSTYRHRPMWTLDRSQDILSGDTLEGYGVEGVSFLVAKFEVT